MLFTLHNQGFIQALNNLRSTNKQTKKTKKPKTKQQQQQKNSQSWKKKKLLNFKTKNLWAN